MRLDTKDKARQETSEMEASGPDVPEHVGKTGLSLVSGFWVVGLGAIAYLTAPGPSADPVYLPASVQTGTTDAALAPPAQTTDHRVDFIVRFRDVAEVDNCLEMFKEDPDGARAVFANWAEDHASLSGMTLRKTSYAGELILSWSIENGHRPNRADIIAKQRDLQAMPVVKYADPDYTAHAGETR